jgi:hypothetical protein
MEVLSCLLLPYEVIKVSESSWGKPLDDYDVSDF